MQFFNQTNLQNLLEYANKISLVLLFIERKKGLKYLVQGPSVRRNLSVIESYTTIIVDNGKENIQ